MAINGLGSFDMMSTYNRIGVNDQAISSVKAESAMQQPKVNKEAAEAVNAVQPEEKQPELKVNLNLDGMRRKSSFSLEDISRDFSKREPYSMTRIDNNAMLSEMKKAVSDMEKDQSLQQFQYFVGDNNIVLDNEDGLVIRK